MRAKQKEAEKVFMHNIGLWGLLLLIIIGSAGTFYWFHKKRQADSNTFRSEITQLQETIAQHEQQLERMERSDIENKEEIATQRKTIDKLKNTIVERLSRGKAMSFLQNVLG